jgi:hypothetical protein
MTASETVIVGRLQVPAQTMPSRWPEHEVAGQLSREGVRRLPVLFQVSPLRPHPEHEFSLFREGLRLLEEKIRVPFGRVPSEKRGHTRLQFKPVLDGGTLCREVWCERGRASAEVPISGGSHLQDGNRIVRIRRSLGWVDRRIVLSRLPKGG